MIDDIKRKDFIAVATLLPALLLQDDLTGLIGNRFATATPFMNLLCRAIGLPY